MATAPKQEPRRGILTSEFWLSVGAIAGGVAAALAAAPVSATLTAIAAAVAAGAYAISRGLAKSK